MKSGDWRIGGAVYDHDNAVLLAAHQRGKTTNGYPLEFICSELLEVEAAIVEAWRLFDEGEVTADQRDTLLHYAANAKNKVQNQLSKTG